MADPLENPGTPAVAPAPAPASEGRAPKSCGFCGARLATNGDVVAMGEKAEKLRDLESDNRKLTARIAQLETENAELKRAATPPAPEPVRRTGLYGL